MTSVTPYAEVIGDPVSQSRSPDIHKFWLEALGIEGDYRATKVSRTDLAAYLVERRADPAWRGCNVTMPLKLDALLLADDPSDRATASGAANLLVHRDGRLMAANTDIGGILAALPETLMPPGCEVCVLGTGGAARAALAALRIRGISLVLMSARDLREARRLLEEFGFGGSYRPLEDAHNIQTAEVIINATPLGMVGHSSMPEPILEHLRDPMPDAVVFDMVMTPAETDLLRVAKAAGLRTVGGIQMLVEQAADSFELLFGTKPPRDRDGDLFALLRA